MATKPSVDDVQEWSSLDFEEVVDWNDAAIGREIDRAHEYVLDVTGYAAIGDIPAPQYDLTYAEAIQRRVEQMAHKARPEDVETASDFEIISSFSAGSYTETRRDMDAQLKARMVNPWPHLHDLLWRMMTEDKRDQWLEWFGQRRPAFAVTEVDWDTPNFPSLQPPSSYWDW